MKDESRSFAFVFDARGAGVAPDSDCGTCWKVGAGLGRLRFEYEESSGQSRELSNGLRLEIRVLVQERCHCTTGETDRKTQMYACSLAGHDARWIGRGEPRFGTRSRGSSLTHVASWASILAVAVARVLACCLLTCADGRSEVAIEVDGDDEAGERSARDEEAKVRRIGQWACRVLTKCDGRTERSARGWTRVGAREQEQEQLKPAAGVSALARELFFFSFDSTLSLFSRGGVRVLFSGNPATLSLLVVTEVCQP